jgi:hypothetical protein
VSLTSLAKRASRHELEDMVNELDDDELAHLIVRGVRTVKRRMAQGGQGDGRSTRTGAGEAHWIGHCRRSRPSLQVSTSQKQIGEGLNISLARDLAIGG